MKNLLKWLDRIEELITASLFLSAVIIMLYGVFMRYVLNSPQFGLLEVVSILLPWAIFIGFGRALKENHHIAVDVVYDRLPFQIKRVTAVLGNLIGIGFSIFMLISGWKIVMSELENGYVTVALGIPIWITYLILPISMVLLAIYFVTKTFRAVIGDEKEIVGELNHLEHEEYVSDEKKEVSV
ncbi:TRAP transporter small permease [Halobacillus shinanisalinarum]|uniref:TRAP transporter small permease n=1 Tax=Halobacillus shinanisalinarum TaxID=2932258 RepID=A0ABY4H3W6_9BACI|nr:TRAP transporter small permease [Halobacillus shinanisalinarum]UOQ94896.1 TRAP transporter small permease [Halobacillus shinanisalinarum]